MKQFILQYKHAFAWIIYIIFFLFGFFGIEHIVTTDYHIVHMTLDDYIPFCELFVIPYLLWFPYMTGTVLYFLFTDKRDYYKNFAALAFGMTLFLIVSLVYPNGHQLRLESMPRDNICTRLVVLLYSVDTSTNILPSIHVYDTLMAHIAVIHNETLRKRKWICAASFLICISIILSTVFIKQHSAVDVILGAALAVFPYLLLYCPSPLRQRPKHRQSSPE